MQEYTLKQTIDKLERNPNLKFQFVSEESYRTDEGAVIALDGDGRIVNQEGEPILSNFSIRSRFRLVDEHVDVMDALRAFENGKVIYCLYESKRYSYNLGISSSSKLMDDDYNAISAEEILHGKWFIEEVKSV
ncbi:hypothetical protein [Clostridium sp. 001]|uniref:hypothetical protein n=1 Tax=Clostridium sp. 001 TaxID=1970093 RepID=UPI001C2BEC8A|nr:hypothetical protein [Clostridium sp. 001]QXE19506.1 hypothetical protein B5S50_12125 [Clostridium sp. 001]